MKAKTNEILNPTFRSHTSKRSGNAQRNILQNSNRRLAGSRLANRSNIKVKEVKLPLCLTKHHAIKMYPIL